MEPIKFSSGVTHNKIFAHRGDVFQTFGLFKNPDSIIKDDKILTKANRPVLIISNDDKNSNIVRVLPFSTHSGSQDPDSITAGRLIEIPPLTENSYSKSYIDIEQVFTINTYQLARKMCTVSQEIVDTAVALNALSNIPNLESAKGVIKYFTDKYSELNIKPNDDSQINNECLNIDPTSDTFVLVEQDKSVNKNQPQEKHEYPPSSTYEQCELLYLDWVKLSTDGFRYKYKLSKQQYSYLKNKCIKVLINKKNGFTRYDWKG